MTTPTMVEIVAREIATGLGDDFDNAFAEVALNGFTASIDRALQEGKG